MNVKSVKFSRKKRRRQSRAAQLKSKLAAYKKFLADDHDWDWIYILRLLVFKLRRTRDCILDNDIIADAREVATEIDQAIALLDRVERDDYYKVLCRPIEKKYGRLKFKFKELPGGCSEMLTCYSKKLTKRQIAAADAARHRAYVRAAEQRDDDLRLAMTIMAERMMWWWD